MNNYQKRIAAIQKAYRKLCDDGYMGHVECEEACDELFHISAAEVSTEYKHFVTEAF